MFRISNVRIGIKLAAVSAVGVGLVGAILVAQLVNDKRVSGALEVANRQKAIVTAVAHVESASRGMMIALRDLRLATTAEGAKTAEEAFQARLNGTTKYIEASLVLSANPANRQRLETMKGDAAKYAEVFAQIKELKVQVIGFRAKAGATELSPADAARVTQLTAQIDSIARDKGLQVATDIAKLGDEVAGIATHNAEEAQHAAENVTANAEIVGAGLSVITMIILIGTAVFGAFSIAKPLRLLVVPLEQISAGNFAVNVPGTGRKDEVGQIAEAVSSMAQKVRTTIAEVKNSAREVTNASAEISTSTTDLSQRTEEQAASLEETSASMEQISATVRKNAENAQQANQSAAATQQVADRGGEVVSKAVEAMAKIEESSRRISDIITVIDEIARQTNLLALNAAVEAARAGEAGRGFAVVASEVRSLAQRSSQAAKDIKDLIMNSNAQVQDGVQLVNQAGGALNEIVASIKQVAVIVADIANASMEQSTGIDQVNKALTQMDEVTQQNSALVEENAATAKTLEFQAKAMDDQVAFFQLGTEAIHASSLAPESPERVDLPAKIKNTTHRTAA